MATTSHQNGDVQLTVTNQNRTGFKRRQYTPGISIFQIVVGGCVSALTLLTDTPLLMVFLVHAAILVQGVLIATSFLWCEVEDLGGSLSVKFGPLNILCGIQSVEIPYAQIKAYRDPKGCCE